MVAVELVDGKCRRSALDWALFARRLPLVDHDESHREHDGHSIGWTRKVFAASILLSFSPSAGSKDNEKVRWMFTGELVFDILRAFGAVDERLRALLIFISR
jgi:hypothetical protein